jgi:hypothetical protein
MHLEKYFLSTTSQFTSNYTGRLLGVNAKLKLKWMLKREGWKICMGYVWLRTGTRGRIL